MLWVWALAQLQLVSWVVWAVVLPRLTRPWVSGHIIGLPISYSLVHKASADRYAFETLTSFGTDATSLVPRRLLMLLSDRLHDMHEDS